MSNLSPLEILLIVWAVVTVLFVGVLIYRSLVAMQEEDTLILSAAEAKMEEQRLVLTRLSQIRPYLLGLGWSSGLLLAAILGLWVFQKLREASL
jgi:hypothetical protein